MVRWISRNFGPIGLDLGSRSIKLLQLSADRSRLVDAARVDLTRGEDTSLESLRAAWVEALKQVRQGRAFRGREVVISLGARELFVKNVRVAKDADLKQAATVDGETRMAFPASEAEIRCLDVGEVRQGDTVRREVIVLACHRPVLDAALEVVEAAGFHPVAVDTEPTALVRTNQAQFRRDEDRQQRCVFVHVGAASTLVVVAQGTEVLFVKYIDLAGQTLDEAVARHLEMPLAEAGFLRRHNGDRRTDQQDPEVSRSVSESVRPILDRLLAEVSLCVRYHSVTFRGQPLARMVLGGGEACQALADVFTTRLNMRCELSDPLRPFEPVAVTGRRAQWDVVAGLALRQVV